ARSRFFVFGLAARTGFSVLPCMREIRLDRPSGAHEIARNRRGLTIWSLNLRGRLRPPVFKRTLRIANEEPDAFDSRLAMNLDPPTTILIHSGKERGLSASSPRWRQNGRPDFCAILRFHQDHERKIT